MFLTELYMIKLTLTNVHSGIGESIGVGVIQVYGGGTVICEQVDGNF